MPIYLGGEAIQSRFVLMKSLIHNKLDGSMYDCCFDICLVDMM